ncbi:hypothetical protein Acr_15g0013880 [Actinidia rufa]|uniref:Retrovirus-related Pol polyprotein from transposon TNT 1-94-like beta-barrel domain-containing protein n=1 Tax=Actinidia rufa TaxID=165716 RepID=A0A7J0FX84_9ERIC|nr:hypothetical protein Acr_15g0013880 [Actinidia rufa]
MQALLLLSSLLESWETLMVSLNNSAPNGKLTTSMVMDALFNEEARRREMGSTDQSESQALVSEGNREKRPRSRKRSSQDTAAIAVMAVDESDVLLAASDNGKSDWVLDSGSAYHLCRDRERCSLHMQHARDVLWMANNTSSRVVGRGSVRFRMADGRSVMLTEWRNSQSFQGKQGDAVGKEDQRAIPIGGECPDRGSYCPTWDVHREVQRKETKSILKSCTAKGVATPKRVSFALDLISGNVLSSCAGTSVWRCMHFGEKWSSPLMRLRYLGYCLAVLWGSWIRSCQEGQLEDIGLPSSGLEGEIVESSPSG